MNESYKIHIPQFEGPFDLLLFFIERDELDIYDIPISEITREFLAYIQEMEALNMDVASEFILVAGTLMRIKAKMLLPRPELDEKGQEIDPREELISRLIEYKRYKSVLEELSALEDEQSLLQVRGGIKLEEKLINKQETPIEDLSSIDAFTLLKVFKRVWDQHQAELRKPRHVIRKYPYTMEEVRENLSTRIAQEERVDFVDFAIEKGEKVYVVFCFLAILEMAQEKLLRIYVNEGYNQFWVMKRKD